MASALLTIGKYYKDKNNSVIVFRVLMVIALDLACDFSFLMIVFKVKQSKLTQVYTRA